VSHPTPQLLDFTGGQPGERVTLADMPQQFERLKDALSGRYDLERELGAGGMATVYLAVDSKHRRKVAVKVLRAEVAGALGPDRFTREIEIAAQLQHPHIVAVYDSGQVEGFLYYVMPVVEGESLRARIKREGPLPVHEAVRILREILDALAYAHQRGVVHRDIKPDNVMLSGRHAAVTDFGVAKAVSAAGSETLTTVGVTLGTPTYMAPEQAVGQSDIDSRVDLYAVGAVAYEMLTGAPPFERATAQAMLAAHVLEPPVPLETRRPGVPPALASLIMRCLEKDREDRWQSAEEMLPLLEALGTPSGGITPSDTRPIRVSRARNRRLGFWIGGAAAVLTLLTVTGVVLARGDESGKIEEIAVLPIQDLSGKDQIFVDAMHDALINALAQGTQVGIVPRSEVMRFRDGGQTTRQIADELHAGAVIEGTVFRDGNRVRINLQMVEPRSLKHLWVQTYEREVNDVLSAQKDIVRQIAAEIDTVLRGPVPPK
jgi:TolB-like protein